MKRFSFLFCVLLFAAGCGRVSGIPGDLTGSSLTEAQRFTLKTPEGGVATLSQELSQKKLVLVDFWATWCTYCVEGMPELKKLQDKYGPQGFSIIAVNSGESAEVAGDFAKKMQLNFTVALDEDMQASQAYYLVGIPTSFLVNSEGLIVGQYAGHSAKLISDIEKNLK
jgi:thiol-disulfide isomerase/thioredoxin